MAGLQEKPWSRGQSCFDDCGTSLGGLGEDVTDDVVTEMMNLADTDGDVGGPGADCTDGGDGAPSP